MSRAVMETLPEEDASFLELLHTYRDVWLSSEIRGLDHRFAYCVHALDHCLKARDRIAKNNAKLAKDPDADIRDRGFTRCTVLVLCATRNAANGIVRQFVDLTGCEGEKVVNSLKFEENFGDDGERPARWESLPEDYQRTFAGNTDDCFYAGLTLTRKAVKLLAAPLYSEILVASPLGLDLLIQKDKRSRDCLSSVEVLIIDQADVLLMQNYEHVRRIVGLVNEMPKNPDGIDISRVRPWYVDGLARSYRQTVLCSAYFDAGLQSTFRDQCANVLGRSLIDIPCTEGSLSLVTKDCSHLFQRIASASIAESAEDRFKYFSGTVLPKLKSTVETRTILFVPSYFDYTRVRRLLKENDVNFRSLSEYTSQGSVSRTRTLFQQGKVDLLVVTERFHFFHRYVIKGGRGLVFYALPSNSVFYTEMINALMRDEPASSLALFTR